MNQDLFNHLSQQYGSFKTDYAKYAFLGGVHNFATELSIAGNNDIAIWVRKEMQILTDASKPDITTR